MHADQTNLSAKGSTGAKIDMNSFNAVSKDKASEDETRGRAGREINADTPD